MPACFAELLIASPISETFTMADALFLFDVFGGCVRNFSPNGLQPEALEDYIHESAEWFFGSNFQHNNPFIWCWTMDAIRTRINKASESGPDKVAVSSLFVDPHILYVSKALTRILSVIQVVS
jgi:hypothetical protein